MNEVAASDPMTPADPMAERRCTARSKQSGKQCRQLALPGTNVCRHHGGAAPQVQAAARLRLLMAADTVAGALIAIAKDKSQPAAARVSAANSVLDRAGLKPDADLLEARVRAVRATVEANNPTSGDTLITDIEIRLVPGGAATHIEHVNGKGNGHAG